MTINRILLPTDFSELAGRAALVSGSLAGRYRAVLHVLHVAPGINDCTAEAERGVRVTSRHDVTELRRTLDDFVKHHLPSLTLPTIKAVRVGNIVDGIVGYVQQHAIDLVVIGTHARGVLGQMLLGSTSKAVLEKAGCAVLMVPLSGTMDEPVTVQAEAGIDGAEGDGW